MTFDTVNDTGTDRFIRVVPKKIDALVTNLALVTVNDLAK